MPMWRVTMRPLARPFLSKRPRMQCAGKPKRFEKRQQINLLARVALLHALRPGPLESGVCLARRFEVTDRATPAPRSRPSLSRFAARFFRAHRPRAASACWRPGIPETDRRIRRASTESSLMTRGLDCLRGRCSTSNSSPPSKSTIGRSSRRGGFGLPGDGCSGRVRHDVDPRR